MTVTLTPRDQVFYRSIASKTTDPPTTSVLELGCAYGLFVDNLRQYGYNAEGVDGDSGMIDFGRRIKFDVHGRRIKFDVHHGELTALDDVFGNRTFDLIVARGVFCVNSQIDYIADRVIEMIYRRNVDPEYSEEMKNTAKGIIGKILSGSYHQLTPGGFLIVHEDAVGLNSIDVDKDTVEGIGFIVEKLEKNEAILQKPQ